MENGFDLIDHTREIIIRELKSLHQELEETPEDHLWRTLPGIINSVGTLSHHICGNLRHFIGEKLGGDGYVRDIVDEFKNHQLTKKELLEEVILTIAAVNASLEKLNRDRIQDRMPEPPPHHEGRSIGFFLIQLCCHLSRHKGQLNYIRRILASQKTV